VSGRKVEGEGARTLGRTGSREPIHIEGPDGDRPFDATELERDLRVMWKAASSKRGTIYRAALANLISPLSACDSDCFTPILTEITRRHPSRLFCVQRNDSAPTGHGLRAHVNAFCHIRPGGGSLVCSEQIAIAWDDPSGPLVPSAIASLLVGDIPTVLLELEQGPMPAWREKLAGLADARIADSGLAHDPAECPAIWKRRPGRSDRPLHDLAWARLAPWREILAEAFDPTESAGALASIQDVTIFYRGSGPPAGAWLLAGWLASRLDWNPRELAGGQIRLGANTRPVSIRFEVEGNNARRGPSGPTHAIAGIRIRSGTPAPLDLTVRHEGRSPTARVTTRAPRATEREVAFGYREFAACVVGEMHRHEPNRAFEDAARVAEELIGLWQKG